MPDENNAQSLADIFGSSPAPQDVVEDTVQDETALEDGKDDSETDKPEKAEEAVEGDKEDTDKADLSTLLEETEKANKRLEDTRNWGNKAHQDKMKALKRLHEIGEIGDEEYEKAKKEGLVDDPNDMQKHSEEFWQQYNAVKDFLVDQGHNPDELVEAFQGICGRDQSVLQEFMKLPANKKVKFVLEQGREVLDLHQTLKKYGSYSAAIAAIKKNAVDEYLKTNPAPTKDESGNSVKPRTRITAGGSQVETEVTALPSLSQLMGNN